MERRQEVRQQVRDRYPGSRFWYGPDYWRRYPHLHWRFDPAENWWKWATWGAVTRWVTYGWGAQSQAYYNYGENVYYSDDTVYYGDQPHGSAEEYAQQAQDIAAAAPEETPENVEWMPLGVFAVTQDGQASGSDPTIFLQLAVSKQGIIGGTLQNTTTETVESIEGTVDQKSQRAAWTVVGKSWPVMETGIYNLTEDSAACLVHFENGQTQQMLLVRLDDPNQQQ